jgi:hypothetical protein
MLFIYIIAVIIALRFTYYIVERVTCKHRFVEHRNGLKCEKCKTKIPHDLLM